MMMTKQCFGGGVILVIIISFLVLAVTRDLNAMTAFARKYKTSCITCHETYPRLNAVGEAYRLNGYKFEDDERYVKEEPLELGDEAYKKVWPEALWPNRIPGVAGFSAVAKFIAEVNSGTDSPNREADITFIVPHEIEIAWAGSLGDNVTAYGDLIFLQEDYGTDQIFSWLWAKAWIEFSNLLGPEHLLNLRVGSLGMHTIGLYTARNEQRVGLQPYTFNGWFMPWAEAYKTEGIADFRGNSFAIQPQLGIELSGFGKSWLYYAGAVNGNIETPLGGSPDLYENEGFSFFGAGRNTSNKDFYAGLACKIGGLGFDGTGAEGDDMLKTRAEYWRDDSITFSAFGYYGTAQIKADVYDDDTFTTHTLTESEDDFWRVAVGVMGKYKDLTLNAGYQRGRDENPFGILWDNSVDVDAWFFEAFYFVYPWLIPYTRYEGVYFDNIPEVPNIQHKQDREILTVGFKAHIRPNVSFHAEYTKFTNAPDYTCLTDEVTFFMLTCSF